jgi:hypothetical protein
MCIEHVFNGAADDSIRNCGKHSSHDSHNNDSGDWVYQTDDHAANGAEATTEDVHLFTPK